MPSPASRMLALARSSLQFLMALSSSPAPVLSWRRRSGDSEGHGRG